MFEVSAVGFIVLIFVIKLSVTFSSFVPSRQISYWSRAYVRHNLPLFYHSTVCYSGPVCCSVPRHIYKDGSV